MFLNISLQRKYFLQLLYSTVLVHPQLCMHTRYSCTGRAPGRHPSVRPSGEQSSASLASAKGGVQARGLWTPPLRGGETATARSRACPLPMGLLHTLTGARPSTRDTRSQDRWWRQGALLGSVLGPQGVRHIKPWLPDLYQTTYTRAPPAALTVRLA